MRMASHKPLLKYEPPSREEVMAIFEDRLADPNELGSRQELIHNTESLMKVRMGLAPQHHPDFDKQHCIDCADKLPKERLEAGRIRCVSCETLVENKNKLRRN